MNFFILEFLFLIFDLSCFWITPGYSIYHYSRKHKSLSWLHINECSLNKKFDNLGHPRKCSNKVFDITGTSQTRFTRRTFLSTTNINLKNYSFEFTPTKYSAGGTALYITSHLPYKPLPDLNIYKLNQVESTPFQIINPKKPLLSLIAFTKIQILIFLILKITL